MNYSFPNSTAIQEISEVENNQVKVTWTNGATYTYELPNPQKFSLDLDSIVSSKQSIGKFINSQIQQNFMLQV